MSACSSHSRTTSRRLLFVCLLTCIFLLTGAAVWSATPSTFRSDDPPTAELNQRHARFLEEVELLISTGERQVFLGLSEDYRRDAFIRQFWKQRDPYPETGRNEFREQWERRHGVARDRYPDEDDARYRLMATHGEPRTRTRVTCEALRPLELWHYSAGARQSEFWAILVRHAGRFRLWSPSEGVSSISQGRLPLDPNQAVEFIANTCSRGDEIVTALALSPDWQRVGLTDHLEIASDEWAAAFAKRSLEIDPDAVSKELETVIDFVGRQQSRTVVAAHLAVPLRDLELDPSSETRQVARLLLDGEVVRGGELFETFRYRFDLPIHPTAQLTAVEATGDGARLPVTIERSLRPGKYLLKLRLQDRLGDQVFVAQHELDVPRWSRQPTRSSSAETTPRSSPPDATAAQGRSSAGATTAAVGLAAEPTAATVRLRVPRDELLTGRVRVEALSEGDEVARVGFELDGRRLLTKARPPYSVEIDLGRAPRRRELRAFALDREGKELAEDRLVLNSGPNSFSIRLLEPKRGAPVAEFLRAEAEVEVPRLERLDRVEFFLNEDRLATLYQPPFVQPLRVPEDLALSFVRVVAYLQNGIAAEDVVFLKAPDEVEYLDVDFVQLYVSASDRRGRPVLDLSPDEVVVREAGNLVDVRRFETVEDNPIHACLLLDTSTSMDDRLEEATAAALYFFERVLSARDRACLVTFNDHHQLTVPFTSGMEVLAGGLEGLEAEGETALYDSLIHTLFYFGGIRGKRALVLLSDGDDSSSDYRYDEALEFAERSGVSIYAIGLAIDQRSMDTRSRLTRLARNTGGRSYFIQEASELKRLYEKIEEELRSQYLIAYQSSAEGDDFREIEVEIERRGVRARTLRGYYP